jgi:hypothetical protein
MRKILIIADLYHGSPRIPSLSKYLPEFNWEPVVISGHSPESEDEIYRVIQTPFPDNIIEWKKRLFLHPHEGFQKQMRIPLDIREKNRSFTTLLTNLFSSMITYPDYNKNWRNFAFKAANEICKSEKIDAIMSSSSPVTSHLVARDISNKWQIPWIADLRDLWSQNHNYRYGLIRRYFDRRLEIKTLKTANALVTVTPMWAEDLKNLHNRSVFSITNGFDPALYNSKQTNLTPKFSITYTGPIYTSKHNTGDFLRALKELIDSKVILSNDLEVKIYGPINELLSQEIKQYHLYDVVKQYGVVPRKESIEKQKESQLLLLFYWNDSNVKGWYPLKMFEYLASKRPILVTGGSGGDGVEKLLRQTKAGVYCNNITDIKKHLTHFYIEYKKEGKINNSFVDDDEINKYSYRNGAKMFAEILDQLSQNAESQN